MIEKTNKRIIVVTDASFSDLHKLATWACWIVTPVGEIQYCRPMQQNQSITNSAIAELYAICNALAILQQQVKDLENHHVIVYGDCTSALEVGKTKAGSIRRSSLAKSYIIDEYITPIASKCGLFEVRHVKAHTSSLKTAWTHQQHMNNWCDKSARRLLRQIINAQKTVEVQ